MKCELAGHWTQVECCLVRPKHLITFVLYSVYVEVLSNFWLSRWEEHSDYSPRGLNLDCSLDMVWESLLEPKKVMKHSDLWRLHGLRVNSFGGQVWIVENIIEGLARLRISRFHVVS